jgi:hypothetical protein
MTTIPGTDLTTEAARNRASRMLNEHDARLVYALADALDAVIDPEQIRDETLCAAIARAKNTADRDKYTPQESAAAWDIVDALQTLRTTGAQVEADPDQDDHDGKQITRAAEAEDNTDECD